MKINLAVLLFSAPLEGENQIQNSKTLAEYQARKNAINVASSVIRAATDLLHRAQGTAGGYCLYVYDSKGLIF